MSADRGLDVHRLVLLGISVWQHVLVDVLLGWLSLSLYHDVRQTLIEA